MIYLEKTDIYATLTTWIYCHYHMAYNVINKGLKPYINWPMQKGKHLEALWDLNKFNEIPNMYEWYFEQEKPDKVDAVWTWEHPNWGANVNTTDFSLLSQPLPVIKSFYKSFLKFNQKTNERGQALVTKYSIDFKKTIGLTWRGTDVYLDGRPRMPIEKYYKWIDGILQVHPDYRIMCTAEEQGILQPLLDRYPQAFNIDEFVSAPLGAKNNPEKLPSRLSGYEKGLQPVLMVWLFSKCAHYIKNRSSSGAVASWISDGQIISLGHPENLGFPANTDTVEIEGKLYPL